MFKRQFGLHFDYHAQNNYPIGETTNIEDIEQYLIDAKPDFVQCDCKGHPGLSSYPTKVGTPAKGMVKDNLRIWSDACKKHNIPLYVHYSGVWDMEYVKNHPDDRELNAEGKPYDHSVSLFGNYDKDLLIPQLKELITEYGIAGAWVDGEIWAMHRDYSEKAKPFLWEGITEEEHSALMREKFFEHIRNYVKATHETDPNFKITSNWLYSSYAPEKPAIDVDFLSGDFDPNNSTDTSRFESRCLAHQGKPWDLMSWSFCINTYAEKPAVQLCQEAATVLTLGGGYQAYIMQNKDGSARRYRGDRFKVLSQFCRDREMLYGKKPLAQIGLLYSADSFYKMADVFNDRGAKEHLKGTLNALLDCQYTVDMLLEYRLSEAHKYDMIVVPQWKYISDDNKQKLLDYANNGGKLIVIGHECCSQFGKLAGADLGEKVIMNYCYLKDNTDLFAHFADYFDNQSDPDCQIPILDLKKGEGGLYLWPDLRYWSYPSYRTDSYGKGSITYIPFDLGSFYFHSCNFIYQNYLTEVLNGLSAPFVKLNAKRVDITMQENDGGVYLNLVNMNQGRNNLTYNVYDEVPPVYNLEIKINKAYSKVSMPLGEQFTYSVSGDTTTVKMDKLDIHTIIELKD